MEVVAEVGLISLTINKLFINLLRSCREGFSPIISSLASTTYRLLDTDTNVLISSHKCGSSNMGLVFDNHLRNSSKRGLMIPLDLWIQNSQINLIHKAVVGTYQCIRMVADQIDSQYLHNKTIAQVTYLQNNKFLVARFSHSLQEVLQLSNKLSDHISNQNKGFSMESILRSPGLKTTGKTGRHLYSLHLNRLSLIIREVQMAPLAPKILRSSQSRDTETNADPTQNSVVKVRERNRQTGKITDRTAWIITVIKI